MKNKNIFLIMILTIIMLGPISSYAVNVNLNNGLGSSVTLGNQTLSIGSMFANFSNSALAISRLVRAAATVIGLYLVIASIFKFIQVGNSNGQVTLKTPALMFFCGIGLFSINSSLAIVLNTMSMGNGPGDLLAPATQSGGTASLAAAIQGVKIFIQMVGYIAFVRGWLLLNQHAMGKEGTIGRALTHLFGGVAAINIAMTGKILANTIAPGAAFLF